MLENKFIATIKNYQLIEHNDRIIIGLSGGGDSTCLLYLINELKEEYNLYLHIAHLNHLLRGKEAKEDEEFVRELATQFNLPITIKKENVKEFCKINNLSIEEGARILRYKFFEKVAIENNCDKVAVGHTASDRIETVLMRIIKGTGLDGLVSIQPKRKYNNLTIIRPLINITREEIINFLNNHNISYRIDSSNKNTKILRNKIRLELLPQLKNYNKKIEEALLNLSEITSEDLELLNLLVNKIYNKLVIKDNDKFLLNLDKFQNHPLALKRRIIRKIIEELRGSLDNVTFLHIERILGWLNNTQKLVLPSGIYLRKQNNKVIFYRGIDKFKKIVYNINIGEIIKVDELGIRLKTELINEIPQSFSNEKIIYIDYDKIKGKLKLRTRKEGDRFIPFGLKSFKKLKEFFIESKIPEYKRDNIPIIEDEEKIVGVLPYRVDERVKVTSLTKNILKIEII